MNSEELQLAGAIASCNSVHEAIANSNHPCSKVVGAQTSIIDVELKRQRPEPWMGGLAKADLLFVSSNPSINEDPYPFGEVFPTYEWSLEESADFFVNRCNPDSEKVKVTFNTERQPNFLTLCYDGEYRSGVSNPKRPQPTWKNTHDRAVELLGPDANPHFNYAITEIVHCKSKDAIGVEEASGYCIEKWMDSIFEVSPAKVVILLGSKVRDFYARTVLKAPSGFGEFHGYGQLSQKERASRDIFVQTVGGTPRLFIFNWHPTFAGLRIFRKVYGNELVDWISNILAGEESIPTNQELQERIASLS